MGNFNGRRVDASVPWSCWDLAVGTPNEDDDRGEVQIFYGDPGNLVIIGPILRPGEDGMPGARAAGDRFGAALVGFAFDEDGFHDLAIGAPGDGGGRVHAIPGSSTGPMTSQANSFKQQTLQVPDDDDPGDRFGQSVGAMNVESDEALVIGVPGEDMNQGAVMLVKLDRHADGTLIASEPATIVRASDVGLPPMADLHWGEVLASPRAFPTNPAEFP
ncbi:integrin alpha [Paraliomyxa miuraensis]|uniref:integrin alpha n=1 Tax=Paraliomyxa miuraensis TaxID=376150 RepID=UPI0022532FEB|nr:integrin alpha [Paraliomyxa miuraensis]MCX4240063.1 integrin alpha [Paraliomyxa miuraensis]